MFTLLTCKTGNIYKYTFPLSYLFFLSLSLSLSFSIGNLQKYPISPFFVHSPLPLRPPPTINQSQNKTAPIIHPSIHTIPNIPIQTPHTKKQQLEKNW
uniref:Uncharacterized protein n=1 Tax=Podospora anserina (strain S / ATCC MYA-4624 / DSM 980 / FGSC 10383) TaxID=515849 RepID=A0A090CBQ8_PODAN|nr:Putative protein of unknown function [Podospora anserina S mat+]